MGSRIIKAPTPPRGPHVEDGRRKLWRLFCDAKPPIQADLVAYTDGVELELLVGEVVRKRLRFLRDSGATDYADRLARRLNGKGYSTAGR